MKVLIKHSTKKGVTTMMEFIVKIILSIADTAIETAITSSIQSDTSWKKTAAPKVHDGWCDMRVSHESYGRAAFDMAVLDQRMH